MMKLKIKLIGIYGITMAWQSVLDSLGVETDVTTVKHHISQDNAMHVPHSFHLDLNLLYRIRSALLPLVSSP